MRCSKFKKLISDFLENQLNPRIHREVFEHLQVCEACAKEKELYEKSWRLMGELEDIEPEPGFKSRFWNRLVRESEYRERPAVDVYGLLGLLRNWRVAVVTVTTIIIVIAVALPNYLQFRSADLLASKISGEEIVLVENIDLLENLEVIEDIDFLENMELIENLDRFKLGMV